MRRKYLTFVRIIQAGLVSFVRNATLAIAAMAVMVVTLTIVLFSLVANATLRTPSPRSLTRSTSPYS